MPTIPAAVYRRVLLALLLTGVLPLAMAHDTSGTKEIQRLRIVGGLAGVTQYTRHEEPFWTKELSRLTQGKFNADIAPFDRAGVPGSEMLRLIQLGVVPFGTALLSNVAPQFPELAAPDLAGLNPDIATLRKTVSAFRPYLEKSLHDRHSTKLLAIYVYPAQVLFCKRALSSLAELRGRRVRVASVSQADFMTALGAEPVLASFAQVMPYMASGKTECAITGTMSGNQLGLHDVTSYIHPLPLTWGLALFGANEAAWQALPAELRGTLSNELPKLESSIWADSEKETLEGLACNTGRPTCTTGRKGRMSAVARNAEDEFLRKKVLAETVLPRWFQRCGARCKELWEQTIGPAHGIVADAVK